MITKGQLINDRYEILKSIGEGGMANVYLANDTILNRKVAVKVLRGDLSNDEKFIRRFKREAIAASSLSHPNIVEMYDVGEDNGNYYIVMEYIDGITLKQQLKKRGTLTPAEAIDVMLQLTDGVSCAHDSYIIHRDLKPQNIMIKDDGTIKITDFGIAMALNGTQVTQTNSVMGSVHYLPPEQASGKGSSTKSDIYSMGVLFYELLTGKLPFRGDNAVEIALKHMKDPFPSIRKAKPEIPQALENVLIKATAKNPNNRYDTVKEMHDDIKTCMDEKRKNEPKWVYKYPEHDPDEKSNFQEEKIKENIKKTRDDEELELKGKQKTKKRVNFFAIIIALLTLVLLGGVGYVAFSLKDVVSTPENIKIPDVRGLDVVEAEKVLVNLGFTVTDETKKTYSDDIAKGSVVGTDPAIGRSRPKGTSITLIESEGKNETYVIENYVGKNYIEVKTTLEQVYGMKVIIEKKDIELKPDTDTQLIIEQDLKVGTEVIIDKENPQEITLFIPDAYEEYPDFVAEGWSVEEIQEFCDKYSINLNIKYETNANYEEGTVIKQSRTGKIVEGVSLTITVSQKPKNEDLTGAPPSNGNNGSESSTGNP